ncbi:MAG: sigma-70 family RNA polymerase sigma factor [Deltaproteobacteria bacterium]|nr:sigma-70 family RNA polymerase sigma factor [Deltaproteobacteria bacterium]
MKKMKKLAKSPSRTPDPTGSLVEACVAGDLNAREALARWCLPRVRRTVLFAHGPGQDTDDLVQMAMAKAFSRISSFRQESSFFVWVDKVTINVVRDHFRKKKLLLLEAPDMEKALRRDREPVTLDRQIERQRLFEKLTGHFAKVPSARRLPLILSMVHGYSVDEISAITDVGYEAVRKRLWRGRKELLHSVSKDPYCVEVLKELGR